VYRQQKILYLQAATNQLAALRNLLYRLFPYIVQKFLLAMKNPFCTLLLIASVAVAVASCKSTSALFIKLSDYKGQRLEYGSQGGITGGGTTISIIENGQIFSTTTNPEVEYYHGQANAKEAAALIAEAMAIVDKHGEMTGSGNMTYYLVYNDGATSRRITWASEAFPPADVKAFTAKVEQYLRSVK
jgi:hypothetical protein